MEKQQQRRCLHTGSIFFELLISRWISKILISNVFVHVIAVQAQANKHSVEKKRKTYGKDQPNWYATIQLKVFAAWHRQ